MLSMERTMSQIRIMLSQTLLICCLGVAARSFTFGPKEMRACGGYCDNDQYLVCTYSNGYGYQTFPNHCYMDVANACYRFQNPLPWYMSYLKEYNEVDDEKCDYHRKYEYFELPTCQEVNDKVNLTKNVAKTIDTLLERKKEILKTQYPEEFSVGNLFRKALVRFGTKEGNIVIYQTKCGRCFEQSAEVYDDCVNAELVALNATASIGLIENAYNRFVENINNKTLDGGAFVSTLRFLANEFFSRFVPVNRDSYKSQRDSFNKAIEKLDNFMITVDVYSTGKILADSFKKAVAKLNASNCNAQSRLKGLIVDTENIINPYNSSRYPTAQDFENKYGGVVDNKDVLEFVKSYEIILSNAEAALAKEQNVTGQPRAIMKLRNVLSSLSTLDSSVCRQGSSAEVGQVYNLFNCFSSAGSTSSDIATLSKNINVCYTEYEVKNYCLNGISKGSDRFRDMSICISLASKSLNKQALNCCFK